MTIAPAADERSGSTEGPDASPWCSYCDTDEHLVVESIGPLSPANRDLVEVEYACAMCDGFYAHVATVRRVAGLLGMEPAGPGVLHFGHEYIHCGEVMQQDGEHTAREASVARGSSVMGDVRILRCRCGFLLARPL
ncbi:MULTISPECIES: hypothetical protein [unclassified Arthrobacter]|uniref:hypothetical protein n=1 Tax=unclassified Arthrobacter TaxID=235627 RepID=UPI00159E71F4|nr:MULTISPECIES: hypothetical protein [unclassified Arthrobacter]MCQ9165977.1 hypothetical protein [Arthrobacter sp. STN4]NVM98687.1 hypothetical protein [Arthrobacter sp. SDTb3-6]